MSVLIKGVEMPKNCDECLYSSWENFYQIYVCNATRKYTPVLFDKKQVKSTDTMRSGRADNCPLVNVPPHGRLIDTDALNDLLMKLADNEYTPKVFASWLSYEDNAPTIIEAEEEQK